MVASNNRSANIAVYTCIIGCYDIIYPPIYQSKDIDYYLISDIPVKIKGWKTIIVSHNKDELSPAMANRYYKIFPHMTFGNYDYSIYIDGNITVKGDISELVRVMNDNKSTIAQFRHPSRKNIKEELLACIGEGKISSSEISIANAQVEIYEEEVEIKNLILTDNSILIRSHNDPELIKAMNMWWDQLTKYSKRDQISLPYVLNKLKVLPLYYDIYPRKKNQYFLFYEHKGKFIDNIRSKIIVKRETNRMINMLFIVRRVIKTLHDKLLR